MRRPARVILPVLASIPLVVGAPALAQGSSPTPVLGVEWTLTQLDGASVPSDPAITATFASDGTLTGSGGCNQYSATWSSDGTTLTVSDLLATFRSCGDEVDGREGSFFTILQDAATWSLDGSAVTVAASDGSTLTFGGDEAPGGLRLVGSWPLVTVDGEAPPAGMVVTLDIGADGTLAGQACNSYNASYTATADGDLAVGPIAATLRSCGDEADAFESAYFGALQGATGWGWQASGGGTLRLFGDGDLVFGGATGGDDTLTGQPWSLVTIGGAPVPPDAGITATFDESGSVSGSGGCNDYTGSYTVDGDSLSVGPLAATLKSCGTAIDDLESTYLQALQGAVGFAISGSDMSISTSSDVTLEYSASTPSVETSPTPGATPAATPRATSAAPAGDIVGSWKMTTYVNQSLPASMLSIDITFSDDGTFAGFGGCNDYSGRWALDGTRLTISNLEPASSGTCDQLTQGLETGFFSLLPFVDTAEVRADGSLSLVSALAGNQGFVFERTS